MKKLAQRTVKSLLWLLAIYLIFGILVWIFSPAIVRKASNAFLEPQGVSTSKNTSVRINPFASTIKVKNCSLIKSGDPELEINNLELQYRFWPLLKKSLVIEKITLQGAKLDIHQFKEKMFIAGISLMASEEIDAGTNDKLNTSEPEIEDPTKSDELFEVTGEQNKIITNESKSEKSFSLKLQELVFEEFEITYDSDTESHKANIEKLTIEKFSHENGETSGNIGLLLTIAEGNIDLNLNVTSNQDSIKIRSDFTSDRIRLREFSQWLPTNPQIETSFLDFSFKLSALIEKNMLNIQNLTIGDLNFNLAEESSGKNLISFAAVSINLPEILQTEKAILIKEIDLANPHLKLSVNTEADTKQEPASVAVNENSTKDSNDNDKAPTTEVTETPETVTQTNSQALKIGTIFFSKPGIIDFEDTSPRTPFSRKLTIETLQIDNIDIDDTSTPTRFSVVVKDDDYFHFDLSGNVFLLSEKTNLNAAGKIRELALPPLNGYSNQFLGFGVERGHLDSDIDITVKEDELGGDVATHLKGIKFSSNDEDEVDKMSAIDQSSMPLNVALSYLKDKDGNIELKIPLSGNVNDPGFGTQYIVSLVVKKAIMSQAKSYLINTFLPYANVITVAMIAGEHALKVRFEDLAYDPGQIDISESQKPYLDQVAALLKDKKDLRINVCPFATNSEGNNKNDRKTIAKKRAQAFKKYLVENKFANSERVLICEPKIDIREDALPRIEIGE